VEHPERPSTALISREIREGARTMDHLAAAVTRPEAFRAFDPGISS
jgi:hypothetical protein